MEPVKDTEKRLLKTQPARNKIEEARSATVVIKTSKGFGSGFFISGDGYILTNKHVVKADERDQARIEEIEKELEKYKEQLEEEKNRLYQAEKRLMQLKNKKKYANYEMDKRELAAWNRDYKRRREAFESKLKEFREHKNNVLYPHNFRIFLVDETQLPVTVVATSWQYDLALLRLQGYKTPFIEPGDAKSLAHGDKLFAIGSPARLSLKNTVTSGVFSGRRIFNNKRFVQTNAQISPGNSGGPLLNEEGKVVGINTWKIVGEKIEGLGFAIPIDIALEEFSRYLEN